MSVLMNDVTPSLKWLTVTLKIEMAGGGNDRSPISAIQKDSISQERQQAFSLGVVLVGDLGGGREGAAEALY